jgi:hypothetical protein
MYTTPGMWDVELNETRLGCAGLVDQLMVETRAQKQPLREQGVSSLSWSLIRRKPPRWP